MQSVAAHISSWFCIRLQFMLNLHPVLKSIFDSWLKLSKAVYNESIPHSTSLKCARREVYNWCLHISGYSTASTREEPKACAVSKMSRALGTLGYSHAVKQTKTCTFIYSFYNDELASRI